MSSCDDKGILLAFRNPLGCSLFHIKLYLYSSSLDKISLALNIPCPNGAVAN